MIGIRRRHTAIEAVVAGCDAKRGGRRGRSLRNAFAVDEDVDLGAIELHDDLCLDVDDRLPKGKRGEQPRDS